jgi:hypothetical protein
MAEFCNYYSQKWSEVESMSYIDFEFMLKNMNYAKARDRKRLLQLHVYPHAKKNTQQKLHKEIVKAATPPKEMEKRAVKTSDLSGIFGGSIEDVLKAMDGR